MRMSKLVGRTIKETPRDAELISHKYLVRAGYIRQYAAGIYGLLPLAQRSLAKIENIIREEMNRVEGQEIKMPCLATRELWEESGRYASIDKSMFRLKDRNEKDMVLCMTHEEPVVFFARSEITSYRQLPAMLYQIQTKFRDEPRPRGGLIRVREFTMKDAYSFHASEEDLKQYYYRVHDAYERIFKRAGCRNFVSVLSDNGMFGGKFSHEFMMLVPAGEDTIITCSRCDYKANREIATSPFTLRKTEEKPLERVHTPEKTSIAEVAGFLNLPAEQTCKAVMFETPEGEPIFVFVRGDLEVVEAKIKCILQANFLPAKPETIAKAGGSAGSTGPIGLDLSKARLIFDPTCVNSSNLVVGANENDYHLINFNFERDFFNKLQPWQKEKIIIADIAAVRENDPCPECSNALQETRGIEIGNIFHLGTRYSSTMNCTYLDQNSKAQNPIMGCYGIGVGRLLPSIVEESHDKFGMILPITVAPFELQLNVINIKEGEVASNAEKLYAELCASGIDVLMDDRDEKAGSQFADADLLGLPLRIILSPKTLANGSVEFKYRDNRAPAELIKLDAIVTTIKQKIMEEYKRYEC